MVEWVLVRVPLGCSLLMGGTEPRSAAGVRGGDSLPPLGAPPHKGLSRPDWAPSCRNLAHKFVIYGINAKRQNSAVKTINNSAKIAIFDPTMNRM